MNIHSKIKLAITIATLLTSTQSIAADITKADSHFTAKQYELAKKEYLEAAQIGNPHAFYQLGTMYLKGLGVKKDQLNALIYIAMAAEYDLTTAQTTLNKMLKPLDESQKQTIKTILDDYKKTNGKQSINQKYYPILVEENLSKKFTFNGEDHISHKYFSEEVNMDDYIDILGGDSTFDDDGNEETDDSLTLIMSTPKLPFLIVDHDIAPDGSIRNLSNIQKMGNTMRLVDEYKLFPLPIPEFNGQPTPFIHRGYLGAATYSKFTMVEENQPMYSNIVRSAKKMKLGTSLHEQYQYTVALQNFPWLEQTEDEVKTRLLDLSKKGHPQAMFEYGLKLYREQTNIEEGLYWIGLAASYGLARAEYRLGTILTSSPWVEYDESKALFWLESAADKSHIHATLKAAELKLTAQDLTLRDVHGAVDLLGKIESSQHTNPEYFYLLALTHRYAEKRDIPEVIKNLEKAIFMGSNANWDISEWQDLLTTLTQGSVSIVE